MLAYVSGQSNGSNKWEFNDPVLTQQAARERTNPVKPFLEKTFEGNSEKHYDSVLHFFKCILFSFYNLFSIFSCFFFKTGKELIVCDTAVNSFRDIVSILGGPNEKARAEDLIETLTVLPDLTAEEETQIPGHSKLSISGQIKARSLNVFLFGIFHQAITVTSNEGFMRAARMQV